MSCSLNNSPVVKAIMTKGIILMKRIRTKLPSDDNVSITRRPTHVPLENGSKMSYCWYLKVVLEQDLLAGSFLLGSLQKLF